MSLLPDTQAMRDTRGICIPQVGVRNVRYPLCLAFGSERFTGTACLQMWTQLASHQRGAHMSRFLEVLEAHCEHFEPRAVQQSMQHIFQQEEVGFSLQMECFYRQTAPVSQKTSWVPFWVFIETHAHDCFMGLEVWGQSLCPCSKAISAQGAHNQRTRLRFYTPTAFQKPVTALVDGIQNCTSAPLHSLVKRPDEKLLTEQAYANANFVEDILRNSSLFLRQAGHPIHQIEVESLESIHMHNAFAKYSNMPPLPVPLNSNTSVVIQ